MESRSREADARDQTETPAPVETPAPALVGPPAEDVAAESQTVITFASGLTKALFIVLPISVSAVLVAFRFFPDDPMFATGLG